jgi:lycopene cyclase domain-containing protein
MQRYLYLTIDFLTLIFPFLFSFYPKANFSKKWKYLWPAILIPALFFIFWDESFTKMGVWGFNPKYISGIYLFHLPIEEILFFVCVPYACVFTYEAVNYLSGKNHLQDYQTYISILLIFFLFALGILNSNKWYPSVTFVLTSAFILILTIRKAPYLGQFYFAFLFILIPFFIVNGILTGTGLDEPVVWYNNNENLNLRMGTIPFEDIFYGMLLLMMNVSIFETLQRRSAS